MLLQRHRGEKRETNRLKAVMTTTLAIGLATNALADHHEPQGGGVVAMQAHYCTLNPGKDMADVN